MSSTRRRLRKGHVRRRDYPWFVPYGVRMPRGSCFYIRIDDESPPGLRALGDVLEDVARGIRFGGPP